MFRITHDGNTYLAGDVALESETERSFGLHGLGQTGQARTMRMLNVRTINDVPLPHPAKFDDITITGTLTITTEEAP